MANKESSVRQEVNLARWRPMLIGLLLAFVTVAVFWEVRGHDFVGWDDSIHILDNRHYKHITIDSFLQFWRGSFQGLFLPLSYNVWAVLAHFARLPEPLRNADGIPVAFDPAVFHTFNLALHVLNVLLAFFLLRLLVRKALCPKSNEAENDPATGDWAAAAGAALFAIHPIQVESVAWISEMRGLLSAFFSLLALWFYANHAARLSNMDVLHTRESKNARPKRWYFGAATLCFLLALLSKPSAVTLPLLALAIDCWVLSTALRKSAKRLIPWFALSVFWTLVTKLAQPLDGTKGLDVPLWMRPVVAGDALAFYLGKLVLPLQLTIDYGRRPQEILQWPSWSFFLWIIPVTLGVFLWRGRRERPWLIAAGAVAVAALLPVLGLTPFAFQVFSTVADRYLYQAMLGPALALTWLLVMYHHRAVQGAVLVALFAFGGLAAFQTLSWATSTTLFTHALEINPRSVVSHNNLGTILSREGKIELASEHFNQAIALDPEYYKAHYNLGNAFMKQKRIKEAISSYRRALKINPHYAAANGTLASALAEMGQLEEAIKYYEISVRLDPRQAGVFYNWGIDLERAGRFGEAIERYQTALRIDPGLDNARQNLNNLLRQRKIPAPQNKER